MFAQEIQGTPAKTRLAKLAVFSLAAFNLFIVCPGLLVPVSAQAQETQGNTMVTRLDQLLGHLATGEDCETAKAVLDLVPELTGANMRIVAGKDNAGDTLRADQLISSLELRLARELGNFVQKGKCTSLHGRALDLKYHIEQVNEVAEAVRKVTTRCGLGDRLDTDPCDHFQPVLNEEDGHEVFGPPFPPTQNARPVTIQPGFFVKLRGPYVPPYIGEAQEDVRVTAPISPGQCAVVFKETRGLMLRLVFVRMVVVLDPWATPLLQRGTKIPVWALQWVPSEHVKEWNICNVGGKIQKTVTQRIKQEVPLNYFWRYYPKDP
jgi:hypothetical protein